MIKIGLHAPCGRRSLIVCYVYDLSEVIFSEEVNYSAGVCCKKKRRSLVRSNAANIGQETPLESRMKIVFEFFEGERILFEVFTS